jgi:hypothetical protein
MMTNKMSETKTNHETPGRRRLVRWTGAGMSPRKSAVAALALLACGGLTTARGDDNRAPDVPQDIVVPEGNKVHFHGFGQGVQIYTWNGTSWGVAVPEATLTDAEGNVVALHFAGPTWQSNSGSKVVGDLPPKAVIMDRDAIAWLRLNAKSAEGDGIFAGTTYIQRVNTVGGLPPKADGTVIGQVARVPYMADYFFYRASTD